MMRTTLPALAVTLALAACAPPPMPEQPRRQCNPTFQRGDVVAFTGIPSSRFKVIGMYDDCTVGLRNSDGIWLEYLGVDLLEKVQ